MRLIVAVSHPAWTCESRLIPIASKVRKGKWELRSAAACIEEVQLWCARGRMDRVHVSSFAFKRTVCWALLLALAIARIMSKEDESGKIEK